MKEIGGYLELELNLGTEYHYDAIKLNLGRNALEYVLTAKKIQKAFLPYYACDALLEPFSKIGVEYEFYKIDENLEPVFNYSSLCTAEYFLYINYFGIKDIFIKQLAKKTANLIIDNSHAFFSKPISGVDTFYSPRKFFGVSDGGYLYTNKHLHKKFEKDISWRKIDHLLLRIEENAEKGYADFLKNEYSMTNQTLKTMSLLTQSLLRNVDYKRVFNKRNENFMFLYDKLHKSSDLKLDFTKRIAPMVYPFLCEHGERIKKKLIGNKIFVASYWNNKNILFGRKSFEAYLASNIIPLPIDQRYSIEDLKKILKFL